MGTATARGAIFRESGVLFPCGAKSYVQVGMGGVSLMNGEATECGQCGVQFAPQRNGVRFCSRKCSHAAYRERRRQSWIAQMCCGCGVPIIGRARKYCTPDCSQQHRTAMRRRAEPPSIRACPECTNFFMPWRAGVMFCSRICSKRRADRNYCARRRAVGREATNRILDVMV
jgi:hypothetical protein